MGPGFESQRDHKTKLQSQIEAFFVSDGFERCEAGCENSGTNFLNTINYRYNERGWATGISSPQFTQQLKYHEPATGKQYNGNIAQQLWGHGVATASTFTYTYDKLNRLINGTSAGTTVMGEELSYDDMGNIKTLKRETGLITNYTYNNGNKSNRLMTLSGGLTGNY